MKAGIFLAALAAAGVITCAASAQTKLKFAHVYEVSEPYHTETVKAAEAIGKRTNGKYMIEVFAASSLGNENQINQALPLGTVDMIYTGAAFAGNSYKPLAISNAPFIFRDYEHWQAYAKSDLLREFWDGYGKVTGNKIVGITYYGARHTTANKAINAPADMKGMKLRVPPAPLFIMFTKAVGANATPIAFAEVYLALQNGTVDGQENPLPTIKAKKFYEVQSHINLTGHIMESLMTVIGGPLWNRLTPDERKIFEEELSASAARASAQIREAELKAPEEFTALGKTVVKPELAAFIEAAKPLHNDPAAGAGWTREQYDRLQALK